MGIRCWYAWRQWATEGECGKYGEEKIALTQKPRRVTVFLNPAANAGKSRKLFEKNAAPILNLAGLEVNVVRTEYEGQVKKFISVLENGETDAILVAGGDGTLLEAVTGILRKENKKFHSIPVGVIPLGETNTFAQLLYGTDKDSVRMIADAAMAVVNNVTKKVDVLKVDGGEGKTTFALCGMEIGIYRDADERKSRYWYFGPLKSRWTHVRTAMKPWPPAVKASISYVEATAENMKHVEEVEDEQPKRNTWSFWRFLLKGRNSNQKEEKKEEKEPKEEAEQRTSMEVSTVELALMSPNMTSPQEVTGIHFEVGPGEPNKTEVIREGWDRIKRSFPRYGCDSNKQLLVKDVSIQLDVPPPQEGVPPVWYNIDGESFEAIPVTVSLLQKKLNFFYPVFEPRLENS